MKRTLTLFAALVLLAVGATAQKLSYSAVVRNSANELVANKTLTVTISIANSNGGPAVYSETHSGVQTNQNGLLTLVIGDGGSQAGSMSDVTWSTAYITSDYTMPDGAHVTNTVPVTAVPYALSAGNVEGGFEQVNADWNATSGAAQILNKPEIPVVNDGTLTIQKNGQEVGTFTANQAGNTTVNITITPQDIINAVGEMTPEQKSQLCQALNCGGGTPTPPEPTPDCPALGATTITPGTNPVAGSTTYLEIETVIDNYDPSLIDPSTAKFVVSYTVENQSDPISTTVENTYADLIAVGDGIMYYGFEEQQVVTSITVTPYIALTGECASTTPISGVPSTYPNEVISSFTVNNAIISATNGLTCDLELVDANMNHAELSNVTIRVGNSSFTPSVTRMRSINEQYHLSVPYSDIENANLNLNDDVLEDVQVDFTYGDQTFSAANNNAVEADFAICSTLGATTVATTPATGDVVTFVATVDNSNDNITGKYFTITYMEGSVEQTLTLENSAVEINTDGNLVGHITETAATPLYGKTLTVVPTITLNSPCSNSEGQSLVYNMPGQTPTPGTFTCGDDLTVGTNTYPTVLIGTQCWTKTNMREAAGTNATAGGDTSSTIPYHYVDPTSGEYLYNWAAAMQVCPDGWHLPADAEWTLMEKTLTTTEIDETYVGWRGNHAGKLAGGDAWNNSSTPNAPGNTNYSGWGTSGFAAIPAGYYWNNTFGRVSLDAHFWSATEEAGNWAWYRDLYYGNADVYRAYIRKPYGFSVRCLKDDTSGGGETSECPSLGNPTFCKEVGTNKVTITIKTPINHYDANLVGDIIYDVDFSIPMGGSVGSAHASMATDGGVTNIDGNYVCLQEVELDAATWQSNQSLYMDYNRTIEYTSICGGTSTVTDNGSITVYEMPECVSGTCPSLGETGTPTANGEMVTVITPINDYDANKIGLYSYRIYYTDDDFFVKYAGDGASVGAAGLAVSFNPAMELHASYATSVCTLRIVPVLNVVCSDDALVGAGVEYVYVPAPEPFVCGTSTVKDHEEHAYQTVLIGNQCWMAENMRATTSPSTGTNIMNYTGDEYTCTGKMAKWYDNSQAAALSAGYGLLYNWNAAVDTFNTQFGEKSLDTNYDNCVQVIFTGHRRGICPENWHIPTDAEWNELTNYIGLNYSCADSTEYTEYTEYTKYTAKALASTTGWDNYSGDCYPGDQTHKANNDSGFGAVPAGYYNDNVFYGAGEQTNFWSATQMYNMQAYFRHLYKGSLGVTTAYSMKFYGYSVRCLKDND